MLSILFNSFLWKIIVREIFFLLIFQSIFSIPYVYSLKQRLGERATFVFLTELSIAGSFLFLCLVPEDRRLHTFLGLFSSQWLTETHHVWVCQAEIESSVAQTVEISEWIRELGAVCNSSNMKVDLFPVFCSWSFFCLGPSFTKSSLGSYKPFPSLFFPVACQGQKLSYLNGGRRSPRRRGGSREGIQFCQTLERIPMQWDVWQPIVFW